MIANKLSTAEGRRRSQMSMTATDRISMPGDSNHKHDDTLEAVSPLSGSPDKDLNAGFSGIKNPVPASDVKPSYGFNSNKAPQFSSKKDQQEY